jgi:prepilin-type processing-associated H-X9-DG protein
MAQFQPYEDMRICTWGSKHPGGADFAFTDGSICFLMSSLPLTILQALGARKGGENIVDDF